MRPADCSRAVLLPRLLALGLVLAVAVLAQPGPHPGGPRDAAAALPSTADTLASSVAGAPGAAGAAPAGPAAAPGGLMGLIARSWIGRTAVGELYVRGGVFMHALLVLAVVAAGVTIERFRTLRSAKTDSRKLIGKVITTLKTDGVQAAAQECLAEHGPVAAILYAGLQKADQGTAAMERAIAAAGAIELSYLERGLNWLTSVVNIAPLVGFLGTVSGLIHWFGAAAVAERFDARLVAGGVAQALIPTAAGLIVAVPTAVGYNHFVSTNSRFVTEMEASASELLAAVETLQG